MQNWYPFVSIATFSLFLFLSILYFSFNPIPKNIFVFYLIIFFELIISLYLSNGIDQLSYFDFYRSDGNYLISLLFILIGMILPRLRVSELLLIRFIILGIILTSTFALLFYLPHLGNEFIGMYRSHNAAAGLYAIGIILIISNEKFIPNIYLRYVVLLYILTIFFIAESRASLLGLIAAIIYIAYSIKFFRFNPRFLLFLGLFLFVIFPVFLQSNLYDRFLYSLSGDDYNTNTRLLIWYNALSYIASNPFFGVGAGLFNDSGFYVSGSLVTTTEYFFDGGHAHNILLHILSEHGFIGFIILTFSFALVFPKHIRSQAYYFNAIFLLLFISSMFGLNLIVPSTSFIFYLLIGYHWGKFKHAT